ncbi:stellacyanin-like [Mangifera indica]|uniref:stellacyanin-like n=1 Tax=Mangifera indica TaxID=29780 RepID=UPI001CFB1842|nr:stellacyanin-like [Mangifera indica]
MALAIKKTLAFLMIITAFQVSFATVYKVGDSAGWTLPSIGQVNYTKWASNKTFHVGDVLVFTYDILYHNVERVTQKNYGSCNATSPIASYSTGNDSITLKKIGHKYFICGVDDHCQMGMKIDINVTTISPAAPPTAV